MYNMPRAATIIATTDGTLWAMVSELVGQDMSQSQIKNGPEEPSGSVVECLTQDRVVVGSSLIGDTVLYP